MIHLEIRICGGTTLSLLTTGQGQNLKSIRGVSEFHGQEMPGIIPGGTVFVSRPFLILWGTYALRLHRMIRALRYGPDL
jgi:hypothetical protein